MAGVTPNVFQSVFSALRLRLAACVDHPAFPYAFGVAVVGLTFKQLQRGAIVGPMELIALALVVTALASGRLTGSAASRRASGVAALVFAALGVSAVVAIIVDPATVAVREILAFGFSFAVVSAFIATAAGREAYALRALGETIGWYCVIIAVASTTPFGDPLWYYGVRLQGLSDNPNQIAFLALVGLSLLWLFGSDAPRNRLILRLVLPGAGCIAAGVLTASDAFLIALVLIAGIAASALVADLLSSRRRVARGADGPGERLGTRRRALVLLALAVAGLVAVKAPPLSVESMLEAEGGQGHYRLGLWSNAVRAFLESPIVGHGPGAHVPSPLDSAVRGEAHNTFLDLLVAFGIVGTLPVVALVLWVAYRSWRERQLITFLLACAPLASFAAFHFLARQPLLWIILFGCACATGLLAKDRSGFLPKPLTTPRNRDG